jgi:hypothetical protein
MVAFNSARAAQNSSIENVQAAMRERLAMRQWIRLPIGHEGREIV